MRRHSITVRRQLWISSRKREKTAMVLEVERDCPTMYAGITQSIAKRFNRPNNGDVIWQQHSVLNVSGSTLDWRSSRMSKPLADNWIRHSKGTKLNQRSKFRRTLVHCMTSLMSCPRSVWTRSKIATRSSKRLHNSDTVLMISKTRLIQSQILQTPSEKGQRLCRKAPKSSLP